MILNYASRYACSLEVYNSETEFCVSVVANDRIKLLEMLTVLSQESEDHSRFLVLQQWSGRIPRHMLHELQQALAPEELLCQSFIEDEIQRFGRGFSPN